MAKKSKAGSFENILLDSMRDSFFIDRSVTIDLSCRSLNNEYALLAEQICILTDTFEKKIKGYTKRQLLFMKACLQIQKSIEHMPAGSFINYQLFLIE